MHTRRRPQTGFLAVFVLCFCAIVVATASPARAETFTEDAYIAADDFTYDGDDIIVDGCVVTIDGAHSFASLSVINTGTVTHTAEVAGLQLTITGDVTVDAGAAVSVDGKGYPALTGPGAGTPVDAGRASGAGHGGEGGDGTPGGPPHPGGGTYGSATEPLDLGSGGGNYSTLLGGAGGGAIRLTVGGTLTVDGSLTANGGDSTHIAAGGGAGGSVFIATDVLTGSGVISANGGNGGAPGDDGGGGGGGRIALHYASESFSGTVEACGGTGYEFGGAGTIYRQSDSQPNGFLLADNCGNAGAATTLVETAYTFDDLQISGAAELIVPSACTLSSAAQTLSLAGDGALAIAGGLVIGGGAGTGSALHVGGSAFATLEAGASLDCADLEVLDAGTLALNTAITLNSVHIGFGGLLTHTAEEGGFNLTTTGDLTVDAGGAIAADGKGYPGNEGPGVGAPGDVAYAGGGGYGGYGGEGWPPGSGDPTLGGTTYGSVTTPNDFGSGGGYYYEPTVYVPGAGGGIIRITVQGTLLVDGRVSANGGHAEHPASGGGAGGSILINAEALTGTGFITANGGDAGTVEPGSPAGGGGGGGRMAIYATEVTGEIIQNLSVSGGLGYRYGYTGTIYPYAPRPENNPSRAGAGTEEGGSEDIVYSHSGEYSTTIEDIRIPARGMPISIRRTYSSHSAPVNTHFGHGWDLNVNKKLEEGELWTLWLHTGENRKLQYYEIGDDEFWCPGRYGTIVRNPDGSYTLTGKHQDRLEFDANGDLVAAVDRNGNMITLTYDAPGAGPATLTDATGRQITFAYDDSGLLTSITDWAGRTWTYSYDQNAADLLSVTEPATPEFPAGTTTTYGYDQYHRLTSITDPKGQTCLTNGYDSYSRVITQTHAENAYIFDYDADNLETTITDGRGIQRVIRHNGPGNPTEQILYTQGIRPGDPPSYTTLNGYNSDMEGTEVNRPRGDREIRTYDNRGNLLSLRQIAAPGFSDPDLVTAYTYNETYNFVETITDPRGYVTTHQYDPATGDLLSTTQPQVGGQTPVTTYTYNAYGQVETMTDPEGKVTLYEYDAATGYRIRQTDNFGGAPGQVAVTAYTYDAVGNRTSVTDANNHTTTYTYNEQNQLTQEVSPLGYVTRYSYDANGNRIMVERENPAAADGWQTTTYTYTIREKIATETDDLGHVKTYTYDVNNNLVAVEDAEHHTTSHTYDERDLLYETVDALAGTTALGYDDNGVLAYLTDASLNTTTFAQDGFGRRWTTTYPDSTTEVRLYGPAGNLTALTNRRAQTILYSYDPLNRVSTRNRPDYSLATYTYDLVGRLTTLMDATGMTTNSYDELGRLVQVTDTNSRTIDYEYDPVGNRIGMTYPDGLELVYEYDAMNRLTRIGHPVPDWPTDLDGDGDGDLVDFATFQGCFTGPDVPPAPECATSDYDGDNDVDGDDFASFTGQMSGPSTLSPFDTRVVEYEYDPLSRRIASSHANGTETTYTYDDADRLTSVFHQFVPDALSFTYTYDAVGNRLTATDNTGTSTYGYDLIYQLTSAEYPLLTDTTYSYDPVGNRIAVVGGGTTTYVSNNLNQYTTVDGVAYAYDASGNLSSDGTNVYAYDSENRLVAATTPAHNVAYTCDARDLRLARDVDGTVTTFVYDGNRVIAEYDGGGQLVRRYVYGVSIDEVLRMDVPVTPGGPDIARYCYHADALGSVVALSGVTGALLEQYGYGVYGAPTAVSTLGNPFLFTGRRLDAETGLYHYRARAYGHAIGRFLQPDPVGYQDDPALYRYVKNNPVNRVDPLGLYLSAPALPDLMNDPWLFSLFPPGYLEKSERRFRRNIEREQDYLEKRLEDLPRNPGVLELIPETEQRIMQLIEDYRKARREAFLGAYQRLHPGHIEDAPWY